MRMTSSKYLLKLILFSTFLCTVPVMISGYFSYSKSSQKIQEKVNESTRQVQLQTEMRIEQILNTVDVTITQFVNAPLVNNSMQKNLSSEDFDVARELSQRLHLLQSYNLGIQDIDLINLNKEWGINNRGMFHFNESGDVDTYLTYAKRTESSFWIKELNKAPFEPGDSPETEASDYYINFVKKLPINTSNPLGLVVVKIPGYKIKELVSTDSRLGKTFILDSQYQLLASDGEDGNAVLNTTLGSILDKLKREKQSSGFFNSVIEPYGNMGVTFRKSAYNGWIYVSLINEVDLTKESRAVGWISLLTCVLIIAFACLVSILGSRKMYTPVKVLYESIVHDMESDSHLKNKDEFQLIGEGMRNLQQTKSLLAGKLTVQLQALKELFVLKLFQGALKPKEIEEKIQGLGYPSGFRWLCVLTIQPDSIANSGYKDDERDLLMYAVNNIIGDLIPAEKRLSPILYEQSQVTLIGGNQTSLEQFKMETYTLAEEIQRAIVHFLKLSVNIGISRPFHEFYKTPKAYQEGIEALKYRSRMGQGVILFFDDLQPVHSGRIVFPEALEAELLIAIKGGESAKAEELLHELTVEIFQMEASNQDYQVHLVRLLLDLLKLAQLAGVSVRTIYPQEISLFDQLSELQTLEEIELWFRTIVIIPLIHYMGDRKELPYRTISDVVIQMIHEDYALDLTLEHCASELQLHPNYIGRVFFKETGVKFSDYLMEYRLKIAKKWLVESDLKISEIAERLRYNNSQNFIRYFRKLVGVTPGQYREQQK
ncbi:MULTISPECIES: helix-turn-helix domain-containing protein [unclassified Paenibacillus]|uniref:helix-turn-helix domain-containing protein n=1 Tax=unclassified Paenibacillus TaxID=185978 RepID=UPI003630037E